MKIGDKVRFLDAVGGGTVSGFEGRNIVLVEDQDGFDIPVLIRNCVVIDQAQEKKIVAKEEPTAEPQELEPCDKPIAYKPRPLERKGGDKLNIYLCFLPQKAQSPQHTNYDLYFVNDSNYNLTYTILQGSNAAFMLRHTDTAEPNTKILIETIPQEDLNDFQHLAIQIIAFKEEKTFQLKAAQNIQLRLDLTRFYKHHHFRPNEFFQNAVLTIPVVENDQSKSTAQSET